MDTPLTVSDLARLQVRYLGVVTTPEQLVAVLQDAHRATVACQEHEVDVEDGWRVAGEDAGAERK